MKISQLIKKLQAIKKEEGDLNVCFSHPHEYWGSIENLISDHSIKVTDNILPGGPKSGKPERAVVIGDV